MLVHPNSKPARMLPIAPFVAARQSINILVKPCADATAFHLAHSNDFNAPRLQPSASGCVVSGNAAMVEAFTMTYWCSYPGCGCKASYEHGGYFGWYYKCRIHARQMDMDYVWPIGTFSS